MNLSLSIKKEKTYKKIIHFIKNPELNWGLWRIKTTLRTHYLRRERDARHFLTITVIRARTNKMISSSNWNILFELGIFPYCNHQMVANFRSLTNSAFQLVHPFLHVHPNLTTPNVVSSMLQVNTWNFNSKQVHASRSK